MSDIKIAIEHNGKDYIGKIATVDSTWLGWEDHGIFTSMLDLRFEGSGIGTPAFALDRSLGSAENYEREGTAFGLDHIMKVMQTVGVSKWEDIKGRRVIALFPDEGWNSGVVGLANIDNSNKIFIFKDHSQSWESRREG